LTRASGGRSISRPFFLTDQQSRSTNDVLVVSIGLSYSIARCSITLRDGSSRGRQGVYLTPDSPPSPLHRQGTLAGDLSATMRTSPLFLRSGTAVAPGYPGSAAEKPPEAGAHAGEKAEAEESSEDSSEQDTAPEGDKVRVRSSEKNESIFYGIVFAPVIVFSRE
jgi:hypothetical protein